MILIVTIVVQLVLVQFGGIAVRCKALTWEQQGYCLVIGVGSLIWCFLLKLFVPLTCCMGKGVPESKSKDE
jgi:hypothetical protein